MKDMRITIIGGGNLGRSVADGFLKSGILAQNITVTRRRVKLIDDLAQKGIRVLSDNKEAVADADVVASARVGLAYAGAEAAGLPWRFRLRDSKWTSPAK